MVGRNSSKLRLLALQLCKYLHSPLRCYSFRVRQRFSFMQSNKNMHNSWRGKKPAHLWLKILFFFVFSWSWMTMPLHGWLIDDAPKAIGSTRHCLLSRTNCESLLLSPPLGNCLTPRSVGDALPCSVSAKMNNACVSHTDCFAQGLSGKFDW